MRLRLSAVFRRIAFVLFCATIIVLPFRYRVLLLARPEGTVYGDYTDFLLFAGDLTLSLTLCLWISSLLLNPEQRRALRFGPWFIGVPLCGLLLAGLLSVSVSVDPALSAYHLLRLLGLLALVLYVRNEVSALEQLVLPVALQVVIQAVVGIVQVLAQHSIGLAWLGEYELNPAWNGVSIVWAEGVRSLRAYGLSDHPNLLGGCLAFALILLAGWYVDSRATWRTLIASVFTLGALALLLTFSRAAWLALSAASVCALVWLVRSARRQQAVEWLMLAGATVVFVLPFLWQNAAYLGMRTNTTDAATATSDDESRSIYERGVLSAAADQLFAQHALTGVGLGAFPIALEIAYPNLTVNYQPPHIVLVDVAAETGILGAIFYAVLTLAPWLALWVNRGRLDFSVELICASSLLLAITVVGAFDYYPWMLAPGRLWQWLAWGLWGMIYQRSLRSVGHA